MNAVLADETVSGFHAKIRVLLKPKSRIKAKPIALTVPELAISGQTLLPTFSALLLEEEISRAPIPLGSTANLKKDDGVIIIQHPLGGYKHFVLEPAGIIESKNGLVRYKADTQPGSSGAPALNESMHAIALHFFGGQDGNGGVQIDLVKNELVRQSIDFVDMG